MTLAQQHHMELGHTPISYSSLKKFREGGIHHYYRYKERELEPDTSPSLSLGTLIDEYILNRREFDKKFIMREAEAPSSPNQYEFCTSVISGKTPSEAYKQAYKNPPKTASKLKEKAEELYEQLKEYIEFVPKTIGKETYSTDDSFALSQISMNMLGHKKLSPIISAIENPPENIEILTHVQLVGEFDGMPIRGELDLVIVNHTRKIVVVYDLKSTHSFIKNFKYEVRKLDYVTQSLLYYNLVKTSDLVPSDYKVKFPQIIVCRTTGSFDCGILTIPEEWRIQEARLLKQDFETIKWHYENKKFKYPKEYYEGDGTLSMEFLPDEDLWKASIEQQIS